MSEVLLLHCDGVDASTDFPDASSSAHVVTAQNDAQVDTAEKKFGSGSALFDGTGDYLTAPASTDWVLDADFTIDFRYRPTVTPIDNEFFVGTGNNSGTPSGSWLFIRHQSTGFMYFIVNGTGNVGAVWNPVGGTWYHVAATREGTDVKIFIDGTILDSGTISGGITSNSILYIGIGSNLNDPLNGRIDEVRILKGEAAWTANFTPPTAPYGLISIISVEQIEHLEYDSAGNQHWPGAVKIFYTLGS